MIYTDLALMAGFATTCERGQTLDVEQPLASTSLRHDGGRVVFEDTPAALVAARATLIGERLAAYVGA